MSPLTSQFYEFLEQETPCSFGMVARTGSEYAIVSDIG